MSRRRYRWGTAVDHLQVKCERMSRFISDFGPGRLIVRRQGKLFEALTRSITYQQLSGKAAGTIYGRFLDLFPDRVPVAAVVADMPVTTMRSVGLSQAKSLSIQDLAKHMLDDALPNPWQMGRLTDEQIVEQLCRVRGIGPWTAQMYLIFNLGRPDVMPATDLAIQKGVQEIYRMRKLPEPKTVLERTRRFAPYRSVASWYLWRASEL